MRLYFIDVLCRQFVKTICERGSKLFYKLTALKKKLKHVLCNSSRWIHTQSLTRMYYGYKLSKWKLTESFNKQKIVIGYSSKALLFKQEYNYCGKS